MEATAEHGADYRAADLSRSLHALGYGEVTVLDTVASTNAWLVERIRTQRLDTSTVARHGARETTRAPQSGLQVVVAGFQDGGRGRLDRQWVTPPGTAVTFSVACTPVDRAGRAWDQDLVPWLTLLMAHAVTSAVRELTGAPAVVKWPNDVLVHDRKVCGILASLVPGAHPGDAPTVVVGAGINVEQRTLPVPTATSLRLEAARDEDVPARPEVLAAVLERFTVLLDRVGEDPARELGVHGSVRAELEARLDTLGRSVAVQLPGAQEPAVGTATGLGPAGQLVVRGRDGAAREFSAGDVVHVRPAGTAEGSDGA